MKRIVRGCSLAVSFYLLATAAASVYAYGGRQSCAGDAPDDSQAQVWRQNPRESVTANLCIFSLSDGMAAVRLPGVGENIDDVAAKPRGQRGKWGYLDRDGNLAIEPRFDVAYSFSHGLAAVKLNGKWGYIDKKGAWAIKPRFDEVDSFRGIGLASVMENGRYELIDRQGNVAGKPFGDQVRGAFLADGAPALIYLRYGKQWVSPRGKVVLPTPGVQYVRPIGTSGLFVARDENTYRVGVIDAGGKWVVPPKFHEVKASGAKNGLIMLDGAHDALVTRQGVAVTGKEVRRIEPLGDYFWLMRVRGKTMLANSKGEPVVELRRGARRRVGPIGTFAVWRGRHQWHAVASGAKEAVAMPRAFTPSRNLVAGSLVWRDAMGTIHGLLTPQGKLFQNEPWLASVHGGVAVGGFEIFQDKTQRLLAVLDPRGKPLLSPDALEALGDVKAQVAVAETSAWRAGAAQQTARQTAPAGQARPFVLAALSSCRCDAPKGAGLLLSDGSVLRKKAWLSVVPLTVKPATKPAAESAAALGPKQRFAVRTEQGVGMIDAAGTMLVEPAEQKIGAFSHGLAVVERQGGKYTMDLSGKMSPAPDFPAVRVAGTHMLRFRKAGGDGAPWGLYDLTTKKVIVPASLKKVDDFHGGHAVAVDTQERAGVLDEHGAWTIPATFADIEPMGTATWLATTTDHDRSIVTIGGKVIAGGSGARLVGVGHGWWQASGGHAQGYVKADGQWAIAPSVRYGSEFHQPRGLALMTSQSGDALINAKGEKVADLSGNKWYWPSGSAWPMSYQADAGDGGGHTRYADASGKVVLTTEGKTGMFVDGMALITYPHRRGFAWVDQQGVRVDMPRYADLGLPSDGLAFASDGHGYGYLNARNQYIIAPVFLAASTFANGRAVVSTDKASMIIDRQGRPMARVTRRCGVRVLLDADNTVAWPAQLPSRCR
jgi:hypothetical protein